MKSLAIDRSGIRNLLWFLGCIILLNSGCNHVVSSEQNSFQHSIEDLSLDRVSAEMALKWYDLELRCLRQNPGFAPPLVARSLGYTGITLYESVVHEMPTYQSLATELKIPGLPLTRKFTCHGMISANAALAMAVKYYAGRLTEKQQMEIDSLEQYYYRQFQSYVKQKDLARSVTYGKDVAAIVYGWSKTDGGYDRNNKNYSKQLTGPLMPGRWEATSYAGALLPEWGNNRPFLKVNVTGCQPGAPPEYDEDPESLLYQEAEKVYEIFVQLDPDQARLAQYWADPPGSTFTPAGHTMQILCQVIKEKNLPMDQAVIGFVKTGIALNDAFIACWKTKYQFNFVRPITYIRKHIRKDWIPFIQTPSFPEYPSGHSVQAAAAAEVLESLFGEKFSFTDISNDTLGYEPRHFESFDDFAMEVSMSRVYGGIHFPISVEQGLWQGQQIGKNVNALSMRKP